MLSFLNSLLLLTSLLQGPGARPTPVAPAAKPAPATPIAWSATRPLTVADFLGRPGPAEQLAALTTSDLKANAACRDFVFKGTVRATFDPNTSWIRSPATISAALLRHEQVHFDLTEVYARLMRQKLLVFQARADCAKLQPAFNNLTQGVYAQWDREQNRYDAETNHGLNAAKQAFWETQTRVRLEQLKAFAVE